MVLTNVWVRRFCHQVPSGQCWILIDSTDLHGANYFGLALSRALAKWAKAIERSLSASATVGASLEFNSHVVLSIQELAALKLDEAVKDTTSLPICIALSPVAVGALEQHHPPTRPSVLDSVINKAGYSKKHSHWSHHQFFFSSPLPLTHPIMSLRDGKFSKTG